MYAQNVAKIGSTEYETLQAALDAAHDEMTGDVTVELTDNTSGYSIVHQKAGLNLTIDGKDKTLNGQIIIDGDGRASGTETLTIQNVKFEGNTTNFCASTDAFVIVPSCKTSGTPYYTNKYNYAHNITVSSCDFTSTSSSLNVVAFKVNSGAGAYNVVMSDVTCANLHSLAQLTGTTGATFNNCSAGSKNFINISGGAGDFSVTDCSFTSSNLTDSYAIRVKDASSAKLTLDGNNDFKAGSAIVLNATGTGAGIEIKNGSYTGDIVNTAGTLTITGGTFSTDVSAYLGDDYSVIENNGMYTVFEGTPVAKINNTYYSSLAEAVAAATEGQTVKIIVADSYTLPNIPNNITLEGDVDGVVFNHTTAGNIASIPNGATFKNVTFNFGNVDYHGFQHAGTINMEGCTLNGKLFSYGDMNFTECSFNQSASDYHMWAYSGNLTYTDCTFTNSATGKFINVYNESGATRYSVTVNGCTFINNASAANKAALNVKATCGTTLLAYDVIVNNCTTEGAFPEASTSDALVVLNSLIQVDDRPAIGVDNITVTLDGALTYPAAVAQIGETSYPSLQAAVNAAQALGGAQTITLLSDISGETVTIQEVANFQLTIDGQKDESTNYTVDAVIVVDGLRGNGGSTTNGASVTLQNIAFVKTTATDGIQATHYPHHLTIQDCTYSGYDNDKWFLNASVDGPLYGVTVKNVTVENARLIYANLADDAVFQNITATNDIKVGFNVKTSGTALIENCQVTTGKYAFRDYSDGYEGSFTLKDNTFISTSEESDEGVIVNRGGAAGTASINVVSGTYTGRVTVLNGKTALNITGGTFSVQVPDEYLAEGYGLFNNNDGTYTVQELPDVAMIGETAYKSLAAAVAAAVDGDVITMVADEAINVEGYGITIPATKNIVLDLNGHEVAGTCSTGATSALIRNLGTLTIQDSSADKTGKLTFTADPYWVYSEQDPGGYASNLIRNEGTLTVESGYLLNNGLGSACYAIDSYSAGHVTINGGTVDAAKASAIRMFYPNGGSLTITDGIIGGENTYIGLQVMGTSTNGAEVNLEGGTYNGSYAIYAGGGNASWATSSFNISGGTYNSEVGFTASIGANNINVTGGTFYDACVSYGTVQFIKGGTFTEEAMYSSAGYLADGYKFVQDGEMYLTVPNSDPREAISTNVVYYYWLNSDNRRDGGFYNFYAPFEGPDPVLMDEEFIELRGNITLTKDVTYLEECSFGDPIFKGGTFTLTFGEYNIDLNGFAFPIPVGVSVITDKQTDIFSAIEGYKVVEAVYEDGFIYTTEEVTYVAQIGDVKYESLQDALDAAEAADPANIVIDLLADATLDITARANVLSIGTENTQSITINGNNHTLTFNQKNSDWNDVSTANDAVTKLILNDMAITNSGHNDGPWNRHDINFSCDVTLNNVTSDKALAFKNGATLNNVTITETGSVYGIWIQPNGQDVSINGLTVTAERGIKVDDQYVENNPALVNLDVQNATFNTTKKAAILVKSGANTVITVGENVNIENVAADNTNVVWVDEDRAADYYKVTTTGATMVPEGGESAYVASLVRGEQTRGYYATFAAAYASADYAEGDTYKLHKNTTESVEVAKVLTIVKNGCTAANITAAEGFKKNETEEQITFVELPDVAQIGDVKYKSLQAALDAAYEMTGDVTIELIDDIEGYSIVRQKAGLNLTIDGANKKVSGNIVVDGNGRSSGTETLTIQNIQFEGDGSNFCSGTSSFVEVPSTKTAGTPFYTGAYNYAHNITIDNCSFTSTTGDLTMAAIRSTSGAGLYNITINNTSGSGLHSLAQLVGTTGGSVTNCTVTESESFVNVNGGSGDFIISGNTFTSAEGADGYGIRENGTSTAVLNLTDNTFTAASAVVLGKTSAVTAGTINVISGTYFGEITKTDAATGSIVISGGTYTIDVPAEYIIDGYYSHNNGDGTYTVQERPYVAQIGDEKYKSLAEAVAAVLADGTQTTITMIDNEMINVVGSAITIPAGKNVVIDLNGFQVVGTAEGGSTSALITNRGTLTIMDSSDTNADGTGTGKLISGATTTWIYEGDGNYAGSYASNTISNSGTLNVESGYIENLSTGSATYAVDNNSSGGNAILNMNGGLLKAHSVAVREFANSTTLENTVNVNGGTIEAGYSAIWIQLPGSDASKAMKAALNVTGGTLTGGSYAFYDYSYGNAFTNTQFNLDGGTFNGDIFSYGANINITDGTYNGDIAIKQSKPSTVAVSGGTFAGDIYAYGDNASEAFITGGQFATITYEYEGETYDCDWIYCLAEDCSYEYSEETGMYEIIHVEAQVGDVKYETFAEAAEEANGEVITLLANIEDAYTIAVDEILMVKLNGHTLTVNAPAGYTVSSTVADDVTTYSVPMTERDVVLTDGQPYTFNAETQVKSASYVRNVSKADVYCAWYVPFDYTIPADETDLTFYRINLIANSPEQGGEVEGTDQIWIYLSKMNPGEKLTANRPYVFKSATTGELTFTVENATLYAPVTSSRLDNSTTAYRYDFYGTYASTTFAVSAATPGTYLYYVNGNGQISKQSAKDLTLGSYRWYIRATQKEGGPNYAPVFVFVDDNDDATGISQMDNMMAEESYYNLNGMRINKPARGAYIIKYKDGSVKKIMK